MKSPFHATHPPQKVNAPANNPATGPSPAAARVGRFPPRLRALLLASVTVALSAFATFAGFEIFSPDVLPVAMRGKWVVVEGEGLKGATLELFANGSMVGTILTEGTEVTIKGRVQVMGNSFRVTRAGPKGGVEVTAPEEILDLTDRQFVVQDAHGEVLIMRRPDVAKAASAGGER